MNHPSDLTFLDRQAHNAAFQTVRSHLGEVVDFCVPVNPYYPTKEMLQRYRDQLEFILTYYPEENEPLSEIVANHVGVPASNTVLGNGSTELITAIDHVLIRESFITSVPTFGRWTDQSLEMGKKIHLFQRLESDGFHLDIDRLIQEIKKHKIRSLAISNPNNPTGSISLPRDLERLLELDLDVLIVDESFIEFASVERQHSMLKYISDSKNLVVLRSLGKSLGAHGIRLGFSVASNEISAKLRRFLPKWNINSIAEAILRDFPRFQPEYELSRENVIADRQYLYSRLSQCDGIQVFPSYANFLYVKVEAPLSGKEIRNQLIARHGCFIRECGNKVGSSSQFLRIAVNPREKSDLLVNAFNEVMSDGP